MAKSRTSAPEKSDPPRQGIDLVVDAVLLALFLALSVTAFIVIAVAAPIALLVSAIAGMIPGERAQRGWREAHAG